MKRRMNEKEDERIERVIERQNRRWRVTNRHATIKMHNVFNKKDDHEINNKRSILPNLSEYTVHKFTALKNLSFVAKPRIQTGQALPLATCKKKLEPDWIYIFVCRRYYLISWFEWSTMFLDHDWVLSVSVNSCLHCVAQYLFMF